MVGSYKCACTHTHTHTHTHADRDLNSHLTVELVFLLHKYTYNMEHSQVSLNQICGQLLDSGC